MKRIFACALVMAVLPLMASPTQNSPTNASLATVAYAGHAIPSGGWCQCGEPGCICDPGEILGATTTGGENDGSSDQGLPPAPKGSGFDFGTGTLIFALALSLWARLRA